MLNPLIIPSCSHQEARERTIPLENQCSRLPVHRHDGASLSLVESRRQVVVDIAVTTSHIRQLIALEVGV